MWNPPTLTPEQESEIMQATDRIVMVQPLQSWFMVWRHRTTELAFLDPTNKRAYRVKGLTPNSILDRDGRGLSVERIVGAYANGIIALVNSTGLWTELTTALPEVASAGALNPPRTGSRLLFIAFDKSRIEARSE